jgi:transcriptional regulator with XRE-family HTH domain
MLPDDAVLGELGRRLAAHRVARNLTQAELAEQAGVSKRTVERLEAGAVATRLTALIRLCRVLDLSDRLNQLVPPPSDSPVQLLKLSKQRRTRASGTRVKKPPRTSWTWGDES